MFYYNNKVNTKHKKEQYEGAEHRIWVLPRPVATTKDYWNYIGYDYKLWKISKAYQNQQETDCAWSTSAS